MEKVLIAVPSKAPGGLQAKVDSHFGHCEVYTMLEVQAGEVKNCQTLPSLPHDNGGCLAPVQFLAEQKVSVMIAGGMGMRPLQAFAQAGIDVFYSNNLGTVEDVVKAFVAGNLKKFGQDNACQGGCSGH